MLRQARLGAWLGLVSVAALGCGSAREWAPPPASEPSVAPPVASARAVSTGEPPDAATGPEVSADERAKERARWESFGLVVPEGFPVLPNPFVEPLSRRSFVVPTAWFHAAKKQGPPTEVRAADVLADLDVLERAMRAAYGGWEPAEARGFVWERWFADWRNMLRAKGAGSLSVEAAFAPMKELMAFQLDNHTTIPLSLRFGSGSRSALLARKPAGACDRARMSSGEEHALDPKDPAQQPRAVFVPSGPAMALTPAHYIAYPAARGFLRAIRCDRAWIDATPAFAGGAPTTTLARTQQDEPSARRLSERAVLVRLPTFSKPNAERLLRALPSFPAPTDRDKVLVVDLRDNDGGDAAFQALRAWIPEEVIEPHLLFKRRVGASVAYHALRFGYMVLSSSGLEPPVSDGMAKRLQRSIDDLAPQAGDTSAPRFETVGGSARYKSTAFDPKRTVEGLRVVVLTNQECGSDCEYMVAALRGLPGSVVVGTNTYGVAQFIQPGFSVLPHTRLPFRIALGTSDMYGDGRSLDGYGLDVDVLLPTEDLHQPDAILRLVSQLGG